MAKVDAGQLSDALVCVVRICPFEGAVLVTQAGIGKTAVVNVVVLVAAQPVAAPLAFLGATYQL